MTPAENGQAMDASLTRGLPDLVILDLMLPGEDGLSICRRLRATSTPVSTRISCCSPPEAVSFETDANGLTPRLGRPILSNHPAPGVLHAP